MDERIEWLSRDELECYALKQQHCSEELQRHLEAQQCDGEKKSQYINTLKSQIQVLQEELAALKDLLFGRKTEKLKREDHQFYAPSRGHEVPLSLLGEYTGFIHCDGYAGYDALSKRTAAIQVGCWAHCRRKFIEAKKVSKKAGRAHEWLKQVQRLFKLERDAKQSGWNSQQITEMRQARALPILNQMRDWLTQHLNKAPKESTLGKALYYADSQWNKLINYCRDGRLEMTNNRTERQVKPFTIGRKNWLFCQSVAGAKASAVLYSLMETCNEHDIPVYPYFATVLTRIPRCHTRVQSWKRYCLTTSIKNSLKLGWLAHNLLKESKNALTHVTIATKIEPMIRSAVKKAV